MEDELSATDAQASDLWAKLRGGTAADVEVATAALLERGALRAGSEHIALLIIGALGRVGRCDRALTLLRRVERPDLACYDAALDACARAGHALGALAVLREMPARRLRPRLESFLRAIRACARRWESALAVLREMPRRGVAPDARCYDATIGACARARRAEHALALLRELGARAGARSYAGAIAAARGARDWELAHALLAEMRTRGLEPGASFDDAVGACEEGARWTAASRLLRDAPRRAVLPSQYSLPDGFTSVAPPHDRKAAGARRRPREIFVPTTGERDRQTRAAFGRGYCRSVKEALVATGAARADEFGSAGRAVDLRHSLGDAAEQTSDKDAERAKMFELRRKHIGYNDMATKWSASTKAMS